MQHGSRSIVVVGLATAFLAGCGGGDSGGSNDAGEVNCQNDSRVVTYAPNLTVTSSGGATKYALVSSDPAPPAKGNDTWKLKVTNATSGQGMAGLNLTIQTLMPDHGHGSPTTPTITDDGAGNYTVTPLYLFMPGVWRIRFFPAAASTDTADFLFCVQG